MTRTPTSRSRALEARHQRACDAIHRAEVSDDVVVIDERDDGTLHPVGTFPPRLTPAELDPVSVREVLHSAGCVLVPGLLPHPVIPDLIIDIDRAFDAFDHHDGATGTADPWFDAFIPEPGPVHGTRHWLREGGGLFAADSPVAFERWLTTLDALGITDLVGSLFGERPVTSLDKCSLRRVGPGEGIEWHQDGSFLGAESGALNLWVSLTDTATAPGLDLVARRFEDTIETGTGGASYGWSVGPEVVLEIARSSPVVRPRFLPGDALLFDGLLLHRSADAPARCTGPRYAIETWFFRPSRFPDHQEVPISI